MSDNFEFYATESTRVISSNLDLAEHLNDTSRIDTPGARNDRFAKGLAIDDSNLLPKALVSEQGALYFCSTPQNDSDKSLPAAKDAEKAKESEPAKESSAERNKKVDQKIKDAFGADVFDHLKDWDWLIQNKKMLQDGFKKVDGQDAKWELATRMKELSTVDGKPLIYLEKQDGPTRGNLIPKRYDIMLRRGRFHSDDYIGHLSR